MVTSAVKKPPSGAFFFALRSTHPSPTLSRTTVRDGKMATPDAASTDIGRLTTMFQENTMAMDEFISQARLKELVHYNESTGVFTWARSKGGRKAGSVAGCLVARGYIELTVDGCCYKAHRLAWLYQYGVMPSNFIDHINGIRNDNRIDNLRDVSASQNLHNSPSRSYCNATGVRGVTKFRGRYRAEITVNRKRIHIGLFDTVNEAGYAYTMAKKSLTGITARR